MATFTRPFDTARVIVTTLSAALPDARESASNGNFARYPKLNLRFMVAMPLTPATNLSLWWPASAAVRRVDLPAGHPLGLTQLLELSPFPFGISTVLRSLTPGLPTFYIGFTGDVMPEHDSAVRVSDPPLNVSRAVLACMFQDRLTLEPWAWIDLIGDALAASAPADAAGWRSLATLFTNRRTLQVRDAAGQPLVGASFNLKFINTASGAVRRARASTDSLGNLGPVALPRAGERAELSWQAPPLPDDPPLPVLALYEASIKAPNDDTSRAYPGAAPLSLPAGFQGGHLQVLDLARWYAPVVVSPNSPAGLPWPARFRGGSHLEPLVDGLVTYTRLVQDIRAAEKIHLAGWSFDNFRMRPHDAESTLKALLDAKGRVNFRILVTKSFQPKVGTLDSVGVDALATLSLLMVAAQPFMVGDLLGGYDIPGYLSWEALAVLVMALAIAANADASAEDTLRELVEFTKKATRETLFDVTNDGEHPACAFPAPHPVTLADNPLRHNFSVPSMGNLDQVQELWGVFHQKFQLMQLGPSSTSKFVGYVGGIDIARNRVDSAGHHAARPADADSTAPPAVGPYHDVHARITGPVTYDLIGLFEERYQHALHRAPQGIIQDPLYTPPRNPPPSLIEVPAALPAAAGQHLVRVAQTSFKPGAGRTGLPWSPAGDAPIRETFERAIRSAREYIYIEDQYFTLDDELIQVLRDAADHCRRLVIVVAAATADQVGGNQRRLATYERLAGVTGGPGGWGERMVAGAPFRRPVLGPAQYAASSGRANLVEPVDDNAQRLIYVGPVTRVPAGAPYFFWVGGELMYGIKTRKVTSPGGLPAMEIEVLRGTAHSPQKPWCPHPRSHRVGTPVTFAAPTSIFVHAKLLMVDDLFLAVGSCNWNRRGFYHDGELDAFVIPDRLKAARNNPAFLLRTALWAEHLGITPSMGLSLLADPVQAFELFQRSRYQGNRFSPYQEFVAPLGDLSMLNGLPLFELMPTLVKAGLIAAANRAVQGELGNIWNTIVDPTTALNESPTPGPGLT